jgi:hypothetical protein
MQFPGIPRLLVLLALIGLAGCGTSCFQGFFNSGPGSVTTTANPPAGCPVLNGRGTMRVVALRVPACQTCTTAARVEHMFVTLRSAQFRSSDSNRGNPVEWVAIQADTEFRQIDLTGESGSEVLAENTMVPAGSYRALRLQFAANAQANGEHLQSACGDSWNCVMTGDGRVEPLLLSADGLELQFESLLVVLPDSHVDVRVSLEPRQVFVYGADGLKARYALAAQVVAN